VRAARYARARVVALPKNGERGREGERERERERKGDCKAVRDRVNDASRVPSEFGRGEITDQGAPKQLRCRREVKLGVA